jgi:dihydropteroate synthase
LRLIAGAPAERLLAAGHALPLAGGRFAFTACQVLFRDGPRITGAVAPMDEIRAWSDSLGGPVGERIGALRERLCAPRRGFSGEQLARPLVMGIVNVTPDSFSDGGEHFDADAAVEHAGRLAADGADIVDIGGESVRPGAAPVEAAEERMRVLPVVEALAAARTGAAAPALSIDTRHAGVMEAALKAGATIVNDITALAGDGRSLEVAAAGADAVVLMHMRGEPATMNVDPAYGNAPLAVYDFLEDRVEACVAAGIGRGRLIVDPGIGFGKTAAHNLEILGSLTLYHGIGCPILVGISRKGLAGEADRERPPKERLPGSLAAALAALDQGVHILRVHDVAETHQALAVWDRLMA